MTTKETHVNKVGANRGRPRVWIDGARLTRAGFVGGTVYSYRVTPGRLVLSLETLKDASGTRKVTGRPEGKPIIDLVGGDVVTLLGDTGATHVTVEYRPGRITITPVV